MEVQEIAEKLMNRARMGNSNSTRENFLQQEQKTYKCSICMDTEFIYTKETNSAKPCSCREVRHIERLNERSGVTKLFSEKTLNNFVTAGKPRIISVALEICRNYVSTFNGENGMALLGQPGCGKTHLCIAVIGELMKKGIPALYIQYRDVITSLKQNIVKEDDAGRNVYQTELQKIKTTAVIYIDDIFKGKCSESDVNIMFELINYRYLNKLPTIISSELNIDALLKIDQALGSRIIEMCKGFIIEFKGLDLNHRLNS